MTTVSVVGDVTLEEVIEAIQEALVTAEAAALARRWDDLEREAFAHDVATAYVARRARGAIEAGEAPMDVAAENELIRRAIAAYFHAGKFQALLDLDGVTDIMVNAHDTIWLQRVDGRVERHHDRVFADADDLRDEVAHLARRAGGTERRFDDAKPLLVLRLPDGSRLAAIMNVSHGAAGGDPPQRAARRHARRARAARHHRPGDALAAGGGDGRRDARRRVRRDRRRQDDAAAGDDQRAAGRHPDRRHRGHPRAQPRRRPAPGGIRPRMGDARGEHRGRRRDRPARARPPRPALQPATG